MQGLNSVHLMGRTYNVKKMTSKNGKSITFFTITTYEKQGEGKPDKPLFHSCVAYGKLADLLADKLEDKKALFVEGTLDYYEKDGATKTQIKVQNVSFADSPKIQE